MQGTDSPQQPELDSPTSHARGDAFLRERVLPGDVLLHECLVHQRHPLRAVAIRRGEAAALHDRLTKPRGALGELEAIGIRLAGIAGSALERIPKAGHLANLEAPDAFNRVLEAFLRRVG